MWNTGLKGPADMNLQLIRKRISPFITERSSSVVECLTRDRGGAGNPVQASPASLRCGP